MQEGIDGAPAIAFAREFGTKLKEFALAENCDYVNFISPEDDATLRAEINGSYGTNYERCALGAATLTQSRLRSIKTSWDPDNVFDCNHNITPQPNEETASNKDALYDGVVFGNVTIRNPNCRANASYAKMIRKKSFGEDEV